MDELINPLYPGNRRKGNCPENSLTQVNKKKKSKKQKQDKYDLSRYGIIFTDSNPVQLPRQKKIFNEKKNTIIIAPHIWKYIFSFFYSPNKLVSDDNLQTVINLKKSFNLFKYSCINHKNLYQDLWSNVLPYLENDFETLKNLRVCCVQLNEFVLQSKCKKKLEPGISISKAFSGKVENYTLAKSIFKQINISQSKPFIGKYSVIECNKNKYTLYYVKERIGYCKNCCKSNIFSCSLTESSYGYRYSYYNSNTKSYHFNICRNCLYEAKKFCL